MTEKKTAIEVKREPAPEVGALAQDWEPIRSLRHQIDRLFADFDWPDLRLGWPRRAAALPQPWPDFGAAVPQVDLVERDGGYELQA